MSDTNPSLITPTPTTPTTPLVTASTTPLTTPRPTPQTTAPSAPPETPATAPPAKPPTEAPSSLPAALRFFAKHASPRILLALAAAALAGRLATGSYSGWDFLVVASILAVWPLHEWLIHVFILHAKPLRIGGLELDLFAARKHRRHHADPWNLEILFIPLVSFVLVIPIVVLAAWWLAPNTALALTGLCTYLALALHYEWVHFLSHTRVVPRSAHYRHLIRNHRLHHFRNDQCWYGVSMLGADRPLGTAPAIQDAPRSTPMATLER